MNKKGFTLTELLAVITIIAILSVSAIVGVNAILRNQRIKVATASENAIAESALSKFANTNKLYLPACMDNENYINIDEVILKKINEDLRDQMAFENKQTEQQKIKFIKDYVKNINNDTNAKKNFSRAYFGAKESNCFRLTSVAELIEEGYLMI